MSVWWVNSEIYVNGKMYHLRHCLEGSFSQYFYKNTEKTMILTPERIEKAQTLSFEKGERTGFGMTLNQYLKIRGLCCNGNMRFREPDA